MLCPGIILMRTQENYITFLLSFFIFKTRDNPSLCSHLALYALREKTWHLLPFIILHKAHDYFWVLSLKLCYGGGGNQRHRTDEKSTLLLLTCSGLVCLMAGSHFLQETERNSNLGGSNFHQALLVQHLSYLAKPPGDNFNCYNKTEKDKGLQTLNSTFPKKGHKPNTTEGEMQSALCRPRQELLQYYLFPSSSP